MREKTSSATGECARPNEDSKKEPETGAPPEYSGSPASPRPPWIAVQPLRDLSPRQLERRNERRVWPLRGGVPGARRGFAVSASRAAGIRGRHAARGAGIRGRHAAGIPAAAGSPSAGSRARAGTAAGSPGTHAAAGSPAAGRPEEAPFRAAGSPAAGSPAAGRPRLERRSAEGRCYQGTRSRRRHSQGTRQSLAQASSS